MPPDALRLFIAIELPAPIREALTHLQKQLQSADRERAIRWVAIESVHLTLKFLGETPAQNQDVITKALHEAAKGLAPFSLAVSGAGGFPNLRRPRVVWTGLEGELKMLHALRDSVERTVSPLGYPTEERPFSPHLTLGRARQDASASALAALGGHIATLKIGALGAWQVDGVSLMRSDLRPKGAVYTQLAHVRLTND